MRMEIDYIMKNDELVVLSLFDGMSCGRLALDRAGIKVKTYYSSEIDKYTIKVADTNWPQDSKYRLGDITEWKSWNIDWSNIDLVLAGSPCQSISNLGDGSGLKGKFGLFYHFMDIVNIIKIYNPDIKFLLENVNGKKESIIEINKLLGIEPEYVNSSHFSAQKRNRLYWFNWDITQNFISKDIVVKDILEPGLPNDSLITEARLKWLLSDSGQNALNKNYANLNKEKAACLTARSDCSWNSNYITRDGLITKFTPIECERLQTVPDNYTSCVSNSQRYKMLGNGWTVDVVAYILSNLK